MGFGFIKLCSFLQFSQTLFLSQSVFIVFYDDREKEIKINGGTVGKKVKVYSLIIGKAQSLKTIRVKLIDWTKCVK